MKGMQPIDWAVLPLYLIGITLLGAWTARRVKSSSDFFMPRRFGKAMMITFAFGTGTSSDQAVTVASKTLTDGLSAIWWQWVWLPATPFYWLLAPIFRRLRATTTADVYELRYDRSVGVLFAVVGVVGMAVKIGLLLKGAGAMIDSCTAGAIDANVAILITTALFLIYGMAGGLGAAVVTDFVQGLMTVLFSFLLLPFVLQATGGLEGVRETVGAHNPQMLSLLAPTKINTFFVIMYSIQLLVGIVAQPFIMGVCGAGRTEMDGRVGFMVGNIVKRICTIAWSITSLAAVAWYLNQNIDLATVEPDHLYGEVARAFLPGIFPGLLGIFLACLLASIMSSCDAIMISGAALVTENLYRPLRPNRPDTHYVGVGRLTAAAIVAVGVWFAFWVPSVIDALNIWLKIAPLVGIAFWIGLFWRRATPAGAWAGTLAAMAVWLLATLPAVATWLAGFPLLRSMGVVSVASDGAASVGDAWTSVAYLSAGVLGCVLVSLVTPRTRAEKLQRFYDLTRTPVQAGEVVEAPCTMPVGVAAPSRRMLIQGAGLEVPVPSAVSVAGFLAGWVMVAALVGGFLAIIG
ncbi:Sodium/pantothenate symporter [Botrimarina colliarenosi]|uniref:Sodium/pantothenate symporter n=1 Tax=Botrimarina colliarenosi TaxID=2528001 RepID=A0A5C6AF71_9BACT|nr:sodium:solute symporter family protein [Botrimarina colliarenosi]TWT97711.1 Sodium/pantothenate symporter [Botrimarina colliarenosi]